MQKGNAPSEPDFEDGLDLVVPGIKDHARVLFSIGDELAKESDRGCALVAAAYLENEITTLLSLFFVEQGKEAEKALFDFNGPVGTFSLKIKMSSALGLIPAEIQNALDLVRKLRNDFAHLHEPLDFESPKIKQRVQNLLPGLHEVSFPPRRSFIAKIQSVAATIHLCIVNTHRQQAPVYEPVPMRDGAAEHELELAARRMMKTTSPEITYEQALEMAKNVREIK